MRLVMSVGGSLSEVGPASIACKLRVVLSRIASNDEVGFIIKAAIAFAAKSETVYTPVHREGCNFITGGIMFFVDTGQNTLCTMGPVVSSSNSRHLLGRRCLSQGATIRANVEKVFQFF